jgi:hypothetical protein
LRTSLFLLFLLFLLLSLLFSQLNILNGQYHQVTKHGAPIQAYSSANRPAVCLFYNGIKIFHARAAQTIPHVLRGLFSEKSSNLSGGQKNADIAEKGLLANPN